MPTKKTTVIKKPIAKKKIVQQPTDTPSLKKAQTVFSGILQRATLRIRGFLSRRPHRSFRRTRRRDYVRSLKLPGYWAFTNYVRQVLWRQRRLFFWLVIAYGILSVLLIGLASQDTYTQLSDTLRSTGGDILKGGWGELGKASLLVVTSATGALNASPTEAQQIYGVILILLTWLVTVWLLRAVLAGRKPKLRDGLYNAGAPIFSTFLVGLVVIVQLLPVAIAAIGFTAALPSGLLDGGVEAMVFWIAASLLAALSLYWITSTLIALVVVTLPGMYPMQAIKTAGDLVIGRRVRIMLRILWLLLMLAIIWLVIMVPIILIDAWLKGIWQAIAWLPIVPVALLIMSTLTVVWVASYIYLLYRRVVDDDAAPA